MIREQLLDMILVPEEAYNQSAEEMAPLQLQAAQEVLDNYRLRIPLLDRRATEAGVDRLSSFDDLVPLLFAHSAYKSYPQSFFDKGQWDRLLKWLDTLSAVDVTKVDLAGVAAHIIDDLDIELGLAQRKEGIDGQIIVGLDAA